MTGINEWLKFGKSYCFIMKENSFYAQVWENGSFLGIKYSLFFQVFSESIYKVYKLYMMTGTKK